MTLSPAQRWALAPSAILARLNRANPFLLGHAAPGDVSRKTAQRILSEWWGIEDREELEQTMRWLDTEGHSEEWRRLASLLEQVPPGTRAADIHLSAESAASGEPPVCTEVHARLDLILRFREAVGSRALLAWDLGRLSALAGWGFLAGYLSEDDAWRWALDAARRLQKLYTSWLDYGKHYVLGLCFWRPGGGDENQETERLVEAIVAEADGPWSLAWDTPLSGDEHPEATLVKRTRCHVCGAPKVARTPTAYVYCDFCAAFIDWDFQRAVSDPRSKLPGPLYEALLAEVGPELRAALKEPHRERYRSLQKQIFGAYVEACPAACPPRVKDPVYREAYVSYEADLAVARDVDPEVRRLSAELDVQTRRLAGLPTDPPGKMRVESASFWRLFEAYAAQTRAVFELVEREQLLTQHPDRPPLELLQRQGFSALVQGWLPFLAPADAEALLDRTGLRGEYVAAPTPTTERRHCGGCGGELSVVEGARKVLCDHCGKVMDVARGELPCTGCGAPVCVPFETSLFACPYCATELRAMRWAGLS